MSLVLSNTDAVLVAIPMIGMLFVGVFRLDEMFSKPKKKHVAHVRALASLDEQGRPSCLDPDEVLKSRGSRTPIRRHRVTR